MLGEYFSEKRGLIEAYLEKIVSENEGISDIEKAMRYSLLAGGKRLRPILLMAAVDALGKDGNKFLPVACALEMIHTYSLIHDDLPAMDNDDYRRGKLTNHKVFGEAHAILAGDGLLTKAFEVICTQKDVDAKILVNVISYMAKAAGHMGMVGGQTIDLNAEKNIIDIDELKIMHMAKTGALFKAALLCGGYIAEASEKDLIALEKYAENFGLAFQITDDILDVVGDSQEMGKAAGSDMKKEKCTYTLVYGLEGATKLAEKHVDEAANAVSVFGDKAKPLVYLVNKLVARKK